MAYTHDPLDITPTMTANNAPSPNVASASSEHSSPYSPWYAFDDYQPSGSPSDCWSTAYLTTTGWLKFDFGSGNTKVVKSYKITTRAYQGGTDAKDSAPKIWTLQGSNNNSDWTTVDTVTNYAGWTTYNETKEFICDAQGSYRYYMLNVTANNGSASYLCIGELELFSPPDAAVWLRRITINRDKSPRIWKRKEI